MIEQTVQLPFSRTQEHRLKMSYEEFLVWSDEDVHAEWEDGEVIVFMPPNVIHQRIELFLSKLISEYAGFFDLGEVLTAPFEVRLVRGHSSREPDLIFIANENLHRLDKNRLEGPPDLVVEVISKESASRDRNKKYTEYAQAGVPEYWLIDPRPRQQHASFYANTPSRDYRPIQPDREGRMHSTVLCGFWLREEWLWQTPFPSVDDLLYDIIGEAYARRMIEQLRKRGFLPMDE